MAVVVRPSLAKAGHVEMFGRGQNFVSEGKKMSRLVSHRRSNLRKIFRAAQTGSATASIVGSVVAGLGVVLGMSWDAHAANIYWTGGTSGGNTNLSIATNWAGGVLPSSSDAGVFSTIAPSGAAFTTNHLYVGTTLTAIGGLVFNSLAAGASTLSGNSSGTSANPTSETLSLSGLSITASATATGGGLYIGNASNDSLTLNLAAAGTTFFIEAPTEVLSVSSSISLTGGRLIKTGAGTLVLNSSSTNRTAAIGGTEIDGGTISSGGTYPLLTPASTTLASGLGFNGGTFQLTSTTSNYTLNNNVGVSLGSAGGTVDVTTSTINLSFSGDISGTGMLTKVGLGTLTLSGSDLAGASFQVNAGTLAAATSATAFSYTGANAPGSLVLNGGTFRYTSSTAASIAGTALSVSSTGGTVDVAGTGNLTLGGSVASAGGVLTKVGTGMLVLTYNPGGTVSNVGLKVDIEAGSISSGNPYLFNQSSATSNAIYLNGGNFRFNTSSGYSLNQFTGVSLGTNGGTIDTAATGGRLYITDAISGAAGTGKLTKLGNGTLIIAPSSNTTAYSSTFTGGMSVSAGALLLGNTSTTVSATGTGAINVAAAATIGGSGIILSNTTLAAGAPGTSGAYLAPNADSRALAGQSQAGILGVSGATTTLAMLNYSTLNEKLDPTGSDEVLVENGASLVFGDGSTATNINVVLSGDGVVGTFNNTKVVLFDLTGASGLPANFNLDTFTITNGLSAYGVTTSAVQEDATSIYLTVSGTVPEPTTFAVIGSFAGCSLLSRRRRSKRATAPQA